MLWFIFLWRRLLGQILVAQKGVIRDIAVAEEVERSGAFRMSKLLEKTADRTLNRRLDRRGGVDQS